MGANHPAEIAALCEIARPDSGLITNIGKAHLEGFGSFEGVVSAKNELFDYLRKARGKAIVNADDTLLMELSKGMERFTYGSDSAEVKGKLLKTFPFLKLQWQSGNEIQTCDTQLYGSYNFPNLMAAAAVGTLFGISVENINGALAGFVPKNNRSQQMKTDKNQLVLDAYNANPVSLREALKSFEAFRPENPWLILGDMFELGKDAQEEHRRIIRQVEQTAFRQVLFVGKDFKRLETAGHFLFFETTEQAGDYLQNHPIENATVLLKGSRGMHLESLLKYL
jgi:UDP-N-acetylmuramoyl-tripeptide--D-alanyl-D-alanine ligase